MRVINGSPSWITALVLVCFFLVLGAGAWYSASLLLDTRQEKDVVDVEEYQSKVLFAESEALSGQLVAPVLRARELAKARIFRGAVADFASMKKEKKDRAQEDFENFVNVSGFMAGHLFSPDGHLRATTMGKLDGAESAFYAPVRNVAKTRQPYFSPMFLYKGLLVSNLFIPVYPPHVLSDSAEPEYVLALIVPLHDVLRSFLTSVRNLDYDTAVRLVQRSEGGAFQEIVVAYPDLVKVIPVKASLAGVKAVEFGGRADLNGTGAVYSSATYLPAVHWWIVAETDREVLAAPIREYRNLLRFLLVVGGVLALFFIASVVLFFSRYRHHREEKALAQELESMRRSLAMSTAIGKVLPTAVCLVDPDGETIAFANDAFANMCGKPLSVILDLSLTELFNPAEAEDLQHGVRMLTMSGGRPHSQVLETYRGPSPRLYAVTTLQCRAEDQEEPGILFLFRDVTEESAGHAQDINNRQQIINALIRAVESVPFLDGHTALLRRLSVEIAETLLLSDADCATVEAAAILSQVGKTFVPRDIMQKEGKLTPEEIRETRRYVEHTCRIIEGIDFDLPIADTIRQMQETLDGTGYPNGLKGNEVSMLARILGVANTFSALVKKRSYRKAKTAWEAIDVLRQSTGRYDATVIRALEAVVESASGQHIMRENDIDTDKE
ncbi:HD domain-containing phosphohydrolase [Pseudodesulfovibrio sp.]|uniref:HD domain-containing phosphohydrolase n=1 Tax=Pseudodesulfovibrio sp. TaxID=2035812 RepID=UPI00261C8BB0|nr:HD domain-containing phosphohydrolase [Pseudodesulfovibrio sp.]MDD3312457.1 PAS domain-containing protein [Pseudodesulfovibrio sp.]